MPAGNYWEIYLQGQENQAKALAETEKLCNFAAN